MATEAEVVAAEGAVRVEERAVQAGDMAVISDLVARHAPQVVAEATQARVPLLEDDCLSLNFADLLCDNPLCHLLKNNKLLLDDLDLLSMANDFLLLLDDHLAGVRTVEVITAIEVVEVIERGETTPVAKAGEVEGPR